MNPHELSLILLDGIRDLVQTHSTVDTHKLLSDTYMTLVKQHQPCTYANEEINPLEIIALGTLAYHLSKTPPS